MFVVHNPVSTPGIPENTLQHNVMFPKSIIFNTLTLVGTPSERDSHTPIMHLTITIELRNLTKAIHRNSVETYRLIIYVVPKHVYIT